MSLLYNLGCGYEAKEGLRIENSWHGKGKARWEEERKRRKGKTLVEGARNGIN